VDGPFFEAYLLVRKSHAECGDSAFLIHSGAMVSFGVFDGVSGQSHSAEASSRAAGAALESLKEERKVSMSALERALSAAGGAIERGYTTASICMVGSDGTLAMASVGDSPVYGLSKDGSISLELPLDRAVKEGDSVLKYTQYRNMLRSALGPAREKPDAHLRKGELSRGEGILVASDGLSDNLHLLLMDGYVTDASGCADLSALLGSERSPERIAAILESEIARRRQGGRIEGQGRLIIPKDDDLALVAFRFK